MSGSPTSDETMKREVAGRMGDAFAPILSGGSDPIAAAEVIERADAALYQAKQAGRNRSFSHTGDNAFSSH